MAKKNNKQMKRRLVVFGTLSVISIVYFIFVFIKNTSDIRNLKNEVQTSTNELNKLKHESENLKIEIEKLKDPEYIARFAREEYSYSKEKGEYVIKIENDEPEIVIKEVNDDNTYIFIIVGSGVLLLGIIIYIIKK